MSRALCGGAIGRKRLDPSHIFGAENLLSLQHSFSKAARGRFGADSIRRKPGRLLGEVELVPFERQLLGAVEGDERPPILPAPGRIANRLRYPGPRYHFNVLSPLPSVRVRQKEAGTSHQAAS